MCFAICAYQKGVEVVEKQFFLKKCGVNSCPVRGLGVLLHSLTEKRGLFPVVQ